MCIKDRASAGVIDHWNTQEQVEQLLREGNLYHLDAELGGTHDRFASQSVVAQGGRPINKRWCQFKHRDCDRRFPPPTDEHAQTFQHLETLLVLNSEQQTPWTYLFQDGKWLLSFEERSLELTEERMKLIASGEEEN